MFRTIVYICWGLLALFFYLMALYGYLEKLSKDGSNREKPEDYFRSAIFVTGCAAVAWVIDQFLLQSLVDLLAGLIPIEFYQVIVLPVVLVIGAKLVGGADQIRITKVTHVSKQGRYRKR